MRILLACDHGAWELKNHLRQWLKRQTGVEVVDLGVDGPESVDYPDCAAKLCRALLAGEGDRGVLMCGTGLGVSIAANRFPGIRAALCHDETTARLSRQHNDANVLVMGGRTTGPLVAERMLAVWLETPFEGGRHARRIALLERWDESAEVGGASSD
ncbi:MAG: ribose 5-phosphate isomerase B [Magnetococcales bacterium]|nr:ribose 5-phosphate isomerase B [Magnetococcales bacterium]